MEPYFEFYSDLDLLIGSVEELQEKCMNWWFKDTPFSEKEPNDSRWHTLAEQLQEVLDILNDEPFFESEE